MGLKKGLFWLEMFKQVKKFQDKKFSHLHDKSQYSDDTIQEIKYGALYQSGVVYNGLYSVF